ncbi:membrane protein UL45 [Saimiriine alphaherpesvirus 1]|uniref:Membrane protein UL45 n=1 Tax=Saimiriine herpesvirus 1 (strain MV-5-4-PSL) TaxID=10353 RepID=E2IUC5_SHV1|nr:membrane protein UL45 [Saimiriine alphaherpesvirus 1]ADO13783.1 membrane protein UL45 [Saimiriine alphaherpesvirus 1]
MAGNPLDNLRSLDEPEERPRRSGCAIGTAAAVGGVFLGALALAAALVLAAPGSAWTLGPCSPGWIELNSACLADELHIATLSEARSRCGPSDALPPPEVARQLGRIARLGNLTLEHPVWVAGDGVAACIHQGRVAAGGCPNQALGLCYRPRPEGVLRWVIFAARRYVGLA